MTDLGDVVGDRDAAVIAIVVSVSHGPSCVGAKASFDGCGARRPGGDAAFSQKMEEDLAQHVLEVNSTGEPKLVELVDESCGAARLQVYLEPREFGPELLVLGQGAVASAVAQVGRAAGFRVKTEERFFDNVAALGANVHVVVATGHEADEEALKAALGSGTPASVQLVASSRRAPTVLAALSKAGVPEDKLSLIRSPAGLDLGGNSPREIAVSILAEIVALRRGGSGKPLCEVKGTKPEAAPRVERVEPRVEKEKPKETPSFTRKHKVKPAIEDSGEFQIPTRHDEDFRDDSGPPSEEKAEPSPERSQTQKRKKLKKEVVDDDDDFRPSRSEREDEEESFR